MGFEPGEVISQLGCHIKHVLHKECLKSWVDHNRTNGKTAICP